MREPLRDFLVRSGDDLARTFRFPAIEALSKRSSRARRIAKLPSVGSCGRLSMRRTRLVQGVRLSPRLDAAVPETSGYLIPTLLSMPGEDAGKNAQCVADSRSDR